MTTTEKVFELIEKLKSENLKFKKRKIGDYTIDKELGLVRGTINNWRKGINKPSADAIVKIAKYFNVTTDYLLTSNETETEKSKNFNINSNQVINSELDNTTLVTHTKPSQEPSQVNELETELLNVFKNLTIQNKIKLLNYAYELEN